MLGLGLTCLTFLMIGWFYVWTVAPGDWQHLAAKDDASYFNLLVRGMLKGQLSLDVPADPYLATLANPYDPAQRAGHGLHDASYFRGKYYIYFGVTPVVLLYLPFHLLSGTFITDNYAVMIFSFAGFLLAWATLRAVVRRHFPETPWYVLFVCGWVLGLANMVPPLLRRPAMWEVPISCGYALFMLTLYCVYRALVGRRTGWWTLAASLAMGLCIGARPVYLPGAVVLLAPLLRAGWEARGSFWRRGRWWTLAAATLLPIMAVGVALAAYNYLRFGSVTEFGQTYQMAGDDITKLKLFSLGYLPFNLRLYLFSTAGISPYFPFLTVISPPAFPPGHLGVENPYGMVPGMPWVLFSIGAVWGALRHKGPLGWWCGAVLGGVVLTMGMVFCFAGVTGRYQVDFTPGWVLLATVGVCWWVASTRPGWWRRGLLLLAAFLAGWSMLFNVLISLQHNRLFEANHPELYAKVAKAFNQASHWGARLVGHRDGPVELRVVFPTDKRDKIEPLVVTGREFLSDYLFVHYLDRGLIRFGLEHTSRGTWTGPVTRIDPGAEYTVVVQMGSLHPPAEHPAYDGLAPEEMDRRTRAVKVLLNGRTVLQLAVDCYDATGWQPSIGTSGPNRPGFKVDFSGRILGWKRVPPLEPDFAEHKTGKLHLLIKLPAFTRPKSEPLLSTGETGKGDLIYIRYLDATHYQIGHDRWGYGGSVGPVIGYDPEVPLDLDISCPPLLGEAAPPRLLIALNGSPLIDVEEAFHPSRPTQIAVGRNLIGASTAEAEFTGTIEVQERVQP